MIVVQYFLHWCRFHTDNEFGQISSFEAANLRYRLEYLHLIHASIHEDCLVVDFM